MYSSLTNNVILTDKCNGRNGNPVCKITPHHMAGVMSGAECATYLANTARECSANYCIGVDGDIACNVEEENRAWTSSSWDNDKNAITIEVSDSDDNWNISDASWQALVNLCVDICRRYRFTLTYTGDDSGSLTEHRMFANTECPGEPLHARMAELAQTVNAQLNGEPQPTTGGNQPIAQPTKSIDEIAQEVIAGAYGNGSDRMNALTNAGYDANAVQARVNQVLGGGEPASQPLVDIEALANAVIAGQYGTGDDRRNALGDNYDAVQARVNELMAQSQPSADIDDLARRTIAGEFGNGDDRRAALGNLYDQVQARVNKMM
jgi:hypothetical protein